MRVLIVEHKEIWGGGQVALVNLLGEWQRAGAPVAATVVCPPRAELAARLAPLGVECVPLDLGAIEKTRGVSWNLARRVRPTRALLTVLRRSRTDVLYANGAFSFLASVFASKLARVPIVWVEHNTTLPSDGLVKRMIGWANRIVVVSAAIREQFVALEPKAQGKIRIVPNGVNPQKFAPARAASAALRAQWGGDTARVIGTVSRLSPEKGGRFFVAAANALTAADPNVRAVIAGGGPERAALEAQAENERIYFLGARDDIPALLNALDVFVLASTVEAQSIATVEAMACALPVVASNVPGQRDVVIDGETGLLIPAGDSRAFADAIAELLADEARRQAMGERGRARVLSEFTVERMAQRMYESLVVR